VKQYLKPNAYNQSELDWTLMTICFIAFKKECWRQIVSDFLITDGAAAVLAIVVGLIDMGVNHCPNEGCLASNDVQGFNTLAIGETYFQDNHVGEEIYYRRDTGLAFGPFQNVWGVSATNDGELWIGAGHALTYNFLYDQAYVQLHAMAGLYEKGDGVGLGGPIEFRSGIELGYEANSGVRVGLGIDHRSNAGLYSYNPGLETFHLRVAVPLR
jgi:lipid A 3-O-deacylase